MDSNILNNLQLTKVAVSKIDTFDFENVKFGAKFTDHMLTCAYKNGEWGALEIKPYAPITLDPSARVFHYGQAIFEGMKAYKQDNNDIWLFRPDENFHRFNKSAIRLAMPTIDETRFIGGLKELIKVEKEWVRKGLGNSLYIRPFMIATESGVIASPSSEFLFCILLSPAKSYYSGKIKVQIADYYSRAANGGIGAAKAAGNYSAQFYPTKLAQEAGYNQVIWTDSTHTHLEESGTMNVFFRINNTLYTAPTSDRILDGVTRKSLIALAEHFGYQVKIEPVKVETIIQAAKDGSLKEIFGAGTAAVVNQIEGFAYKDDYYELPNIADEDAYALQLKNALTKLQNKSTDDPFNWTVKI
ncbi:branched-chain amino acid aminotransferase [Flavobacterium sp. CBA20B-1]|uniref:branched-chain amino acid aminotransferase n=1 Tax=unclassified Flavobacterium TaxID=196869 RepID=UPI002224C4D9|nr:MULTISPECIES: branched-chain amino acid aminotransferase [unclassified Flavobacterium]WCM42998.1 branched-chain amino acid aminotransferase [Flavobacterium sp. CBA20B-1]